MITLICTVLGIVGGLSALACYSVRRVTAPLSTAITNVLATLEPEIYGPGGRAAYIAKRDAGTVTV